MTDEQIVIEVAKLDGWKHCQSNTELCNKWWGGKPIGVSPLNERFNNEEHAFWEIPNYINSRDATVPVIEKWANNNMVDFSNFVCCLRHELKLDSEFELVTADIWFCLTATPRQLCIALLRATGKYKEEPAIAQ